MLDSSIPASHRAVRDAHRTSSGRWKCAFCDCYLDLFIGLHNGQDVLWGYCRWSDVYFLIGEVVG